MRKTAVFLVVLPTNQVSQFRVPLQPDSQDMLVVSSVENRNSGREKGNSRISQTLPVVVCTTENLSLKR